ncbi:hypothetical protein GB864_07115 [Agromyces sp. MMS17-SY077]|uniref:Recombinase family protein n=2 Tax=Agromyces seonyuensis TaxID=2662446 RepID=A0A6I4NVB1_9MICO|nr:recombinase family protein [Agromyces seonyuensis]MWB98318.1 hypothetical protein [Agromyces seonyuensis]
MESNRRAALYLRQSIDNPEGIERQRARCRSLAEARGWTIVATYEDNEVRASATRGAGTGWARMLDEHRDFDVLVAVDLDRLLRSTKDLNTLIDAGVPVVTVNGEIDLTTADGEFRATMLAGIARFETRRTSERIKRQKAQRAEQGKWHGGTPPFGFRLKDGTLVEAKKEADMLREAARRLLDDREPLASIVADWNRPRVGSAAVPKRATRSGKHWRQTNLRANLLNRSLIGETKAGVQGWEPILDQRTFDRLGALLGDSRKSWAPNPDGRKSAKYTLSGGLAVCGICGGKLVASMKREVAGRAQVSLGCLPRVNPALDKHPEVIGKNGKPRSTGRIAIDHDSLEEYVFGVLIRSIESSERWPQQLAQQTPETDAKIDALKAERSALRDQRERAGRAYVLGVMSERESVAEVARIDAELEGIGKRLDALLGAPSLAGFLSNGTLHSWRTWAPGSRRAFLRLYIDRIVVNEWPEGVARTTFRLRGETDDAYRERQRARMIEVASKRVKIVWQWEQASAASS